MLKKAFIIIITIITIFFILPLQAFADNLTLRSAIDQGLAYSPDVKSISEQIASANYKKARTLAPDDPSLLISSNDQSSFGAVTKAASTSYQISQPISFPGKAFASLSFNPNFG